MKHNHNKLGWLVLVTILVVILAGCQSAKPTPTTVPTVAPTATIAIQLDTNIEQPTEAPYVLEGATKTASGLQYLLITAGAGQTPIAGDIISMHYVASLTDGTELFNSYTQDQPAIVVWGREQLLPGWEEGIGLMKVGEKAKLVLTPDLAFGADGSGMVPPNSQIIIELELLSAKAAPSPSTVAASKLEKTATGLQYYDLTVGEGTEAITNSVVTTSFTIWVKGETENTYIASSEGRQPITFSVGVGDMVFPGWEQGVVGMKVGGKRLLVIPPELALGEQGGGEIPPNAVLIMEITLDGSREAQKATVVDEKDYITTDSGLKYYDMVAGSGETPKAGQTVVVHYTGWLTDGTQFDSSVDRGEPFSFQLGMGGVIAGWDEGVATMKVGGKRQMVIPAELGYGDSGSGGTIPPGAILIFEVELLEIQP